VRRAPPLAGTVIPPWFSQTVRWAPRMERTMRRGERENEQQPPRSTKTVYRATKRSSGNDFQKRQIHGHGGEAGLTRATVRVRAPLRHERRRRRARSLSGSTSSRGDRNTDERAPRASPNATRGCPPSAPSSSASTVARPTGRRRSPAVSSTMLTRCCLPRSPES
jgi:hypothetical protein